MDQTTERCAARDQGKAGRNIDVFSLALQTANFDNGMIPNNDFVLILNNDSPRSRGKPADRLSAGLTSTLAFIQIQRERSRCPSWCPPRSQTAACASARLRAG